MRFRILSRFVAAGGLAAFALSADPSFGQFPQPPQGGGGWQGGGGGGPGGGGKQRGGGGFGGGNFDPAAMANGSFNKMVEATGAAGGDMVDYSKISPEYRQRTDSMLLRMNQPPLPTSGTVTRDQYRQQFEQRMQTMNAARANGGMGGAAQRWEMSKGGQPGMNAPAAPGMTPGAGGPPGMGGNTQWGAQMSDESAKAWMKRYDTDGDGKISRQEAQARPDLAAKFDQFDTNRDGYLDAAEYKMVIADGAMNAGRNRGDRGNQGNGPGGPGGPQFDPNMQGQQQWGGGPPQQWNGNGYDPNGDGNGGGGRGKRGDPKNDEPERPVVFRYGKLPKELPGWFTSLDEDKDGQIGLYEWRKDGRAITEFKKYDLNDDGFITAEEYLMYRKLKDRVEAEESGEGGPSVASVGGGDRSGGGNTRGGGDRGGRPGGENTKGGGPRAKGGDTSAEKEDRGGERNNKKGNGKNPFKGG